MLQEEATKKSKEKEPGMALPQGCGYRVLFGGVEMPEPCAEGFIQGCDVGELQEPGVCG
ncbi:ZNF816 isoform 3 [Pan troglodytes]|uniref:ZNF816 isoform 3 n=2 Tax=Pan TaxID=9596 RepID=A0A2J8Q7C2_PANTR|nr:ZNF816 isoform 3 [Pan troglodytes]